MQSYSTEVLQFSPEELAQADKTTLRQRLQPAAAAIRRGEVVAFPTETVYGLGANAFDDAAVATIYRVKGRPQDNPLIVHLARREQLPRVAVQIPDLAYQLYEQFSPGPLTLILQRNPELPARISAGLATVAVRFPSHPLARLLIEESDCPIVAPSANLSGRPSPTTAADCLEDLAGKVPLILDGGPSAYGVESTVLDITASVPVILRPGGISREALEAALAVPVRVAGESGPALARDETPRAPGMKYKHYAPRAEVYVLPVDRLGRALADSQTDPRFAGKKRAYFLSRSSAAQLSGVVDSAVHVFGNTAEEASHALFAAFREWDREDCEVIFAEALPLEGAGLAYMNRLNKSAGGKIYPGR